MGVFDQTRYDLLGSSGRILMFLRAELRRLRPWIADVES